MSEQVVSTQRATGFRTISHLASEQLRQNVVRAGAKNGRRLADDETEATVPAGYSIANPARAKRAWRAFQRLGLGDPIPDGVGGEPWVVTRYLAPLDRYAKVANLPADGDCSETPLHCSFWQDVKGETVFCLQAVVLTSWQFFGSADFQAGDFDFGDVKETLAREGRRKVDRLLLAQLGMDSDAPAAAVLARLADMQKGGTLEDQLAAAANALLDLQDFVLQVDRARPEDTSDDDLGWAYPEICELIGDAKRSVHRQTVDQPGGVSSRELRGVNRALLELLYPREERQSRPSHDDAAAAVRHGMLNAWDPLALWTYHKAQPKFGLVVAQGENGGAKLSVAPDSLLSLAHPATQDLFLRLVYRSAKRVRYDPAAPNPTSTFFRELREDPAAADEFLEAIVAEGCMHELAHRTVQQLPDDGQPVAPASPAEQACRREFSQQRWKELAFELVAPRGALLASVAATKNVYKAVMARDTADGIAAEFALELFCDRYGMFADRIDREIDAYHCAIDTSPGYSGDRPENLEQMTALEAAAVVRLLENRFGMTAAERDEIERRIRAATPGRVRPLLGEPFIGTPELAAYQDVLAPHFAQMGDLFPRGTATMLSLRDAARDAYLLEQGMTPEAIARLDAELAAAATAGFLTQVGDSGLTLDEEYFFRLVTEHAAHLAAQGEGGRIPLEHSATAFARIGRSAD